MPRKGRNISGAGKKQELVMKPWQVDAYNFISENMQGPHKRCMVSTLPGTGKTTLMSFYLADPSQTEKVGLVITPQILHEQWTTLLGKHGKNVRFPATDEDVADAQPGDVCIMDIGSTRRLSVKIPLGMIVVDERVGIGEVGAEAIGRLNADGIMLITTMSPSPAFMTLLGRGRMTHIEVIQKLVFAPDVESILPPCRIVPHMVALTETELKFYKDILSKSFAMKDGFMRLVHLLSVWLGQSESKLEEVRSFIAQLPKTKSILIWGADDEGLSRLGSYPLVSTKMSGEKRAEVFRRAAEKKERVVMSTVAAANFGLDLQFFDVVIIVSPIFDRAMYQSVVGRTVRLTGKETDVHIFYGENTVEEAAKTPVYIEQLPRFFQNLIWDETKRLEVRRSGVAVDYDNLLAMIRSQFIAPAPKEKLVIKLGKRAPKEIEPSSMTTRKKGRRIVVDDE